MREVMILFMVYPQLFLTYITFPKGMSLDFFF